MFDRKGPLKTPYDLKKLAVFGAQNVDDQQIYEWPSKAQFKEMPFDLTVSMIVIKELPNAISYIKFIMSDGSESPILEADEVNHQNEKTIVLDEAQHPVRKIQAVDNSAVSVIRRLDFCDADGQLIDNFNGHVIGNQECKTV